MEEEIIKKFVEGCKVITGESPFYEDGVYSCGRYSLDTKSKKMIIHLDEGDSLIVKKGDKFKAFASLLEESWGKVSLNIDLINDINVDEFKFFGEPVKTFVFKTNFGVLGLKKEGFVIDLKD